MDSKGSRKRLGGFEAKEYSTQDHPYNTSGIGNTNPRSPQGV